MVIFDDAVGVDVTDSPVGLRELDRRVELSFRVELGELATRVTGVVAILANKYNNDDDQDIRT